MRISVWIGRMEVVFYKGWETRNWGKVGCSLNRLETSSSLDLLEASCSLGRLNWWLYNRRMIVGLWRRG